MSEETKNNGLKVVIGILIALLIGSGAFMFKMNSDATERQNQLTEQKKLVENELEDYINKYTNMKAANSDLQESLDAEIQKLIEARDSLQSSEATVASLVKYRSRFFQMKKDYETLVEANEILKGENKKLQEDVATKVEELNDQIAVNDSLATKNVEQAQTIATAKTLTVTGLKSIGVIQRSSGKQIPTDKARRADKVKVCFTIPENKIADATDKTYYIQVLDAKNNVIGAKETIQMGDKTLTYSVKTKFYYQNRTLDICEYISNDKFEKGSYFVNIFDGEQSVSNSSFTLN